MTRNKSHKSNWRIFPLLLIPCFLAVMIVSIVELIRPGAEQNEFQELSAIVHSSDTSEPEHKEPTEISASKKEPISTEPISMEDTLVADEAVDMNTEPAMLANYIPIYEMNPDLCGWIWLEGTVLDYPVMQSPDEPERYLRKNLSGEYSLSGVPFMAADCYEGCGNYILYGHNMNNGSMFHTIMYYADENFWEKHPTICFDTLYSTGEYKVYAAFYSKAYYVEDRDVFRVYDYTDLKDEAVFHEFAEQAKNASLYDTGVNAEYGDEFITLITCSYHTRNGRFVVVAVNSN